MLEQLVLLPCKGIRCAWCNRITDPLSILHVRVLSDRPRETCTEPVCNICLSPEPLEIELETDMVTYKHWWQNGYHYGWVEGL